MTLRPVFVLMLAVLAATPVRAAPACHAASDAKTRPLIELYTSEGCDSCPPADRWLASQFGAEDGHGPVALAFHVDYWNRLGWVDRFASAAYTDRQYDAMRANAATFVYTPQVLLQGRDLAGWQTAATTAIDAASRVVPRAAIVVDVTPADRRLVVNVDARVTDATLGSDAQLFVAYADSGLVSEVKAGENRGARLRHDHVVRTLERVGPLGPDGHLRSTVSLSRPSEAGSHPAIVAFVQRQSGGDVLQALALPLDACATH